MDKLKLKWKIFAMLLGFCAMLLVILWPFQTVLLGMFYKSVRVAEVKANADVIAGNIDNVNITETIDGISDNSDVMIGITDMDGDDLSGGGPARMEGENLALIEKALAGGGEFFDYIAPEGQQHRPPGRDPLQSLVYVKLAEKASGEGFAVIVRAVISPVNATVTTLRYQLYIVSGIMIILSAAVAVVMAKRVSKPIEEISKSAAELAKGRYDVHFGGKGFAEIVALSDTLNKSAQDLAKVEGFRRELLANLSHDLRTPLALIYSYSELMHDFPGEFTPEQAKTIMDETKRLTVLVNDVLDISKLENDMDHLKLSKFSLTESIADNIARMNELLRSDGYEIIFDYAGEVYALADRTKIERAFYNLLINAVNYSGDSRTVTVRQETAGSRVRISVCDSGEGISKDELPFIWDRYFKSGKKHKRSVTGTGLGLSIVKKIVELHGGNCGVQSELGKGSVFWFEIEAED